MDAEPMTQKTENAYGQPTLTTLKKANHAIESGAEDLNAPAVLPVRNKPMAPSGKLHFSPAKMAVDEEVDLNEFVNPVPMPPPANVELVDQFPGANENSNFPPDMPDDCRSQQHNSRRVPIPMYFVFVQLFLLFCGIFALTSGTVMMCYKDKPSVCRLSSFSVIHWTRRSSPSDNIWLGQLYITVVFFFCFAYHLFLVINFTLQWIRSTIFILALNLFCLINMLVAAALEGFYISDDSYTQLLKTGVLEQKYKDTSPELAISNIATAILCAVCALVSALILLTSLECRVIQLPVATRKMRADMSLSERMKTVSLRSEAFLQ